MKFSKSAMRARHVQVAHMTVLSDRHIRDEPPATPARRYSTEWYDSAPTNNGIAIPQQLRDRIDAAMARPTSEADVSAEVETVSQPAFLGWGFFR